jgi:glutathione S-transferase
VFESHRVYTLYIANKNYSSWSLRAWLLMRERGIAFTERLVVFGQLESWQAYRKISPAGRVPCLIDDETVVWDSLAIAEYLAERHEGVWPAEAAARAWARSAAAEMHSGFAALRSGCSMSCGIRVRLHGRSADLECDIARLSALWNDGLGRFGGPFLAGRSFTAVDAFFAPVAFRIRTYALELDAASLAYARRLLGLPAMQAWYEEALREKWRDEPHDSEIEHLGAVIEDLRAS